jgi:hypothetical protein
MLIQSAIERIVRKVQSEEKPDISVLVEEEINSARPSIIRFPLRKVLEHGSNGSDYSYLKNLRLY